MLFYIEFFFLAEAINSQIRLVLILSSFCTSINSSLQTSYDSGQPPLFYEESDQPCSGYPLLPSSRPHTWQPREASASLKVWE